MGLFEALASPVRRDILEALGSEGMTTGALAARLHMSQPGISNHLRILLDAGLVGKRRVGQTRLYSLRPEKIEEAVAYLRDLVKQPP
jgi:DNA-binding transcriptional ArsR family regulator